MESIYFVMSWVCHRTCEHCYEDRFHPYHGEELQRAVRQSQDNVPRIIDNFPSRMTYLDLADPDENGNFREKRGRIIVAGDFTTVNHVVRNRLARLLTNGVLDTTFDPGPAANAPIRATAVQPCRSKKYSGVRVPHDVGSPGM